ncbi:MAG: signal recognition particle-docking protein FtsY [Methylomonas sp.]|jgi:fused signal recognition particle receptor|uniref:signal recognition particle-docking protein FtsY n=1 Tax=Methylomonas sp. TaxID=418 RepID=UPI0025D53F82|nr:signal recognition particle-docking protein FtsY [Methylomonas sp.]MCK9606473.1 signal recognition particle-docking protein FtsY [Methylomonas sp.]
MFRKLSLFCAILALIVIVMGAYVRLSDAGLGCPDWPGCYGQAMVNDSAQFKADAEAVFPENPLDTTKAWKEMTHRYLAGGLGIVVLILFAMAWRLTQQRSAAITWTFVLLLLVALQAALGMWTVHLKVMPLIVMLHLLMGFITFWAISWTYLRSNPDIQRRSTVAGPALFALLGMLVLFLQIALGGWVSSNYAALACTDLPRCQGQWLPETGYANAFNFLAQDSSSLSAAGKVAIHALHRVGAVITFLLLSWLMLSATSEQYPRSVRRSGVLLSVLLLVQIVIGIFTVKHGVPLALAVAHNAFAALLMLPLLGIYFFSRYALPGEEQAESQVLVEIPAETLEKALPEEPVSLYLRLQTQLKKTRGSIGGVLSILTGQEAVTRDLLDDVEANLLMADIGIETTTAIIQHLKENLQKDQLKDGAMLTQALKQNLFEMLQPCSLPLQISRQEGPFVILVVGVNGAGKTTSIGKLAHRLQEQGHSVMLAAGDTFRAAAVEQLQAWGERNNVQVVAQHSGADSASVIFDALQSAKAKGVDVLIADTAGRLHTKSNLMEELSKIKRIMAKLDASAPHEILLVLDAGTGQNALSQARLFNEAVGLTGLALTKLDGTAKGGVIFALANQLRIPIRFIGVGEAKEDLQDFDAKTFVDALFVTD